MSIDINACYLCICNTNCTCCSLVLTPTIVLLWSPRQQVHSWGVHVMLTRVKHVSCCGLSLVFHIPNILLGAAFTPNKSLSMTSPGQALPVKDHLQIAAGELLSPLLVSTSCLYFIHCCEICCNPHVPAPLSLHTDTDLLLILLNSVRNCNLMSLEDFKGVQGWN